MGRKKSVSLHPSSLVLGLDSFSPPVTGIYCGEAFGAEGMVLEGDGDARGEEQAGSEDGQESEKVKSIRRGKEIGNGQMSCGERWMSLKLARALLSTTACGGMGRMREGFNPPLCCSRQVLRLTLVETLQPLLPAGLRSRNERYRCRSRWCNFLGLRRKILKAVKAACI